MKQPLDHTNKSSHPRRFGMPKTVTIMLLVGIMIVFFLVIREGIGNVWRGLGNVLG